MSLDRDDDEPLAALDPAVLSAGIASDDGLSNADLADDVVDDAEHSSTSGVDADEADGAVPVAPSDEEEEEEEDLDSLVDECRDVIKFLRKGQTSRALPLLKKAVAMCEAAERSRAAYRDHLEAAVSIMMPAASPNVDAPNDEASAPAVAPAKKQRARRQTDGELGAMIMHVMAAEWGRNDDSVPYGVIPEAVEAASMTLRAEAEALEFADANALQSGEAVPDHDTVNDAPPSETETDDDDQPYVAVHADALCRDDVDETTPAKETGVPDSKPSAPLAGNSGSKGKAGRHSGKLKALAPDQKPLTAYFTVAKEVSREDGQRKVTDELLFYPFQEGDRVAPAALRLWAAGAMAETPPVGRPRRMQEVLCRNELDVRGLGAPRDFNTEAVLVTWAAEDYVVSEMRPAFLGTFNSTLNVANLARPSLDFDWANPFAMPRAAGVLYDVDSGDDWDGDDEGSAIGSESQRSEVSELDSSEQSFIVDDDDDVSGSDQAERDENEMLKSEVLERAQRRKRCLTELVPRYEGVFDGIPLARHPMRAYDKLDFISNGAASVFGDGIVYRRIARNVLEQAGLPIPEELLTEVEREAAAAKAAREAARAEQLAARAQQLTARAEQKATKRDRAPTSTSVDGAVGGAPRTAGAKPVRTRRSGTGTTLTLEEAMKLRKRATEDSATKAAHPANEAAEFSPPGQRLQARHGDDDEDDNDDIPLSHLLDDKSFTAAFEGRGTGKSAADSRRSQSPATEDAASLSQPRRSQPRASQQPAEA